MDGGGDGRRRSSVDIAPEDVYRALARMQNANEDLEFMIDDSLAAKEHSSLSLFSGALTNRVANVKRKLRMMKMIGKGAGKAAVADKAAGKPVGMIGGSKTPEPTSDTALVPSVQPRGAVTPAPGPRAPGALPDVRGSSQKSKGGEKEPPKRPLVNIGTLCSQIRREQQLLLEGPGAAPGPDPLTAVHPPAVARALLAASSSPGKIGAQEGALVPFRITTRKLRPVVKDVGMRERPPDPVVLGKVNYDVLLQEQQDMNKRRLEQERAYEEMLDKFEAYQARLLQMLPAQSVFGNRLTDDLAQALDAPTERIDVDRRGDSPTHAKAPNRRIES